MLRATEMAASRESTSLSRRIRAIADDDADAFMGSFESDSPFRATLLGEPPEVLRIFDELLDAGAMGCCSALANLLGHWNGLGRKCAWQILDRLDASADLDQARKNAEFAEAILEAEHGRAFIEKGGGLLNAARPALAKAAMERPRAILLFYGLDLTAAESDALNYVRNGDAAGLSGLLKSIDGELDRAMKVLLLAAWSCDSLGCFAALFDWEWSRPSDGKATISERWGRRFDRFIHSLPARTDVPHGLDAFFVDSTTRMLEAWAPTQAQTAGFLGSRKRNAVAALTVKDGIDEYWRRQARLQERAELGDGLAPTPLSEPRPRRGVLGAARAAPLDPSPPAEDGGKGSD